MYEAINHKSAFITTYLQAGEAVLKLVTSVQRGNSQGGTYTVGLLL